MVTRRSKPNPLRTDPTRTATLRRTFLTDMRKRFLKLKGEILKLVDKEDAFGLRPRQTANPFTTNNRWQFRTNSQKLAEFLLWLNTRIERDLFAVTRDEIENAFWMRYVEEGYRKGAGRAFDDTRRLDRFDKQDRTGAGVSDFYAGSKAEFMRSSFGQPETVEKVKLLAGRVYTDLKGVTDVMSAQMGRVLTDGLVQGMNPRDIAKNLNDRVDKIGKVRSETIARTEIIRAHAEGQLDALERLGVEKVGVMVEWSTALDERVCPLCIPLEGVVISVKEAHGSIPRHPNCRCAFVPANVGESVKGQKRSKAEIEKARDRSIRQEIPKTSKRTLAEQKKRTRWGGVDTKIAVKRPKSILE